MSLRIVYAYRTIATVQVQLFHLTRLIPGASVKYDVRETCRNLHSALGLI